MSLTANIFFTYVNNTIVWTYDGNLDTEMNGGFYDNQGQSGSKGFEVEYKVRKNWGYVTLSYSYYNSKGINEIEYYKAPNQPNQSLGISPHKIVLNSSFKLSKNINFNPSITYTGTKEAFTKYDKNTEAMSSETLPSTLLVNFYANYTDLFTKGLTFGVGLYNILNQNYDFVQPYNGWHPPLPGQGRKLLLKLTYDLHFKPKKKV